MNCAYFGKCGGCSLWNLSYDDQLDFKIQTQKKIFSKFNYNRDFDVIKSNESAFRNRAEFRFFKEYDSDNNFTLSYAMIGHDKKLLCIDNCMIVTDNIQLLMPKLLKKISICSAMHTKIFSVEFLTSLLGDTLVTLIYHKNLDEEWIEKAKNIEQELNINIIGRSKNQKEILSKDFIKEELSINNKTYKYNYKEGGFTQPNQKVNIQMIEWVKNNIIGQQDLCELYCGGGNFTIPLGDKFDKILATEISKTSIQSAKMNCSLNNINHIKFVRLSAEEFTEAIEEKREFRRIKQENIELKSYAFSTIFLDPPRSGLDNITRELVKNFEEIVYISCNPKTLYKDLEEITKTHNIIKMAFFDQFAYTHHLEMGVILYKK